MTIYVYILECADGKYYVGSARGSLERRVHEHNHKKYDGYTESRTPVKLVYSQVFQRVDDTIAAERQVKGWRRAKKEALIRGEFQLLVGLSKRPSRQPRTQTSS